MQMDQQREMERRMPQVPPGTWVITPQDKARFEGLFERFDQNKSDSVSSQDMMTIMQKHNLPRQVLEAIWNLVNSEGVTEFTKH